MTIPLSWLDHEHRVILQILGPEWTWEEFLEASHVEMEMMDTVDHPVDIIAHGRDIKIPEGILKVMPDIRKGSATLNHPNGGRYVLADISAVVKTFTDIYSSVFKQHGKKIFFTDTFEEALEIVGLTVDDLIEPYE